MLQVHCTDLLKAGEPDNEDTSIVACSTTMLHGMRMAKYVSWRMEHFEMAEEKGGGWSPRSVY